MGRKGESIFKRKDGRYEGRYIKEYHDNKAVYGYVYGNTYSECKRKKVLLSMNNENNKISKNNTIKTLNILINDWLNNKKNLKASTYRRYYNLINEHIINDIGNIKISKLNSKLINDYLNNKLTKGKLNNQGGLSKNTVYDICNILKQVFKENKIDISIMKVTKKIGHGKSLFPKEKELLFNTLINNNEGISMGILLSLLLGLRESEVCGLRFSDIDLDNKIIKIERIVSRINVLNNRHKTKLVLSTPKTENSKRILPIPNKIYKKLLFFKKKNDNNNFLLTENEKFMDPRTFYNKYRKIIKSLGLDYTHHSLRHTFATNCIDAGIDYKSLMELLGHANITTTMNIYVHPTIDTKRMYINKL